MVAFHATPSDRHSSLEVRVVWGENEAPSGLLDRKQLVAFLQIESGGHFLRQNKSDGIPNLPDLQDIGFLPPVFRALVHGLKLRYTDCITKDQATFNRCFTSICLGLPCLMPASRARRDPLQPSSHMAGELPADKSNRLRSRNARRAIRRSWRCVSATRCETGRRNGSATRRGNRVGWSARAHRAAAPSDGYAAYGRDRRRAR